MIEVIQDRVTASRGSDRSARLDATEASRTATAIQPGGLAAWLLAMIHRRSAKTAERHLHVVETLALGGRRQLLLVTCDGERFLVGSGADRVDTIVKVGPTDTTEESWV